MAAVLTNMALTDRAAKLDQDAETLRAKLGKAPPVEKANPLGETLELLLGAAAAALTAWQQAVVAAVFELCLVGVMVIFELLGQAAGGGPRVLRIGSQIANRSRPRQWRNRPRRRRAGLDPSRHQPWQASKPSSPSGYHPLTESGSR